MSALAQQPNFYSSVIRKTEVQVLYYISGRTSSIDDLQEGLDAIARSLLQLQGIARVLIEPAPGLSLPLTAAEWSGYPVKSSKFGSATAEMEAAGRTWGQLKIHFDLGSHNLESPLRFARFAARQTAAWLNRLELDARREALQRRIARLKERLATRKRVQRATGILVQTRGISEVEALLLLVKYSRESRRSLAQVSEAIILSEQDTWLRRPVLRRLVPGEATADLEWLRAQADR